uniref:P-type domain-containing protein n=1 Tax=Macrostomum lignano TaxID=282301 RepID=A0A1I8GBJ9_9PLAT
MACQLPLLALLLTAASATAMQCSTSALPHNARVDCWPEIVGASESACHGRGCCWRDDSETVNDDSEPFCFYPADYPTYRLVGSRDSPAGGAALNFRRDSGPSGWPPSRQIDQVSLSVSAHSDRVARIQIADRSDTSRWRVPLPLFGGDEAGAAAQQFSVRTSSSAGERFFVQVTRNSDAWPLFDTGSSDSAFGPLLFADQFIQLSIGLSAQVIYGLGEHLGPFAKPLNQWKRFVLWNRDAEPNPDRNLYGSHNFLLAVGGGGRAFGIFLLNSNAQEVMLQPRLGQRATVTYRTIGGILDFFVFVGPTPKDVIQQYHELLGPPMMPPLWSLGYHLCRFGFGTLDRLKFIYERNVKINIPIDVMWSDADYMDGFKDWTVGAEKYSGFDTFIKQIHSQHRSVVVIVDPGIKNNSTGYLAYDLGLKMDIWMRTADNKSYIVGAVWPGDVLWPDFTHPNATLYWQRSSNEFLFKYPVDGLWIDMNEPSSFYQGSDTGCPKGNPLDFPPYVPHIIGYNILYQGTVCPSARQYLGSHYDLHNLYSYFEAKATWQVLRTRPDGQKDNRQRQFVLSRSTFPGIQRFAFHWTGDNNADWYNLRYSLSTILSFNLYGIVNTGTDVCGFNSATTEELCIRWTQLGAFYPFMRNHNSLGLPDQDPAAFSPIAQQIMRYHISLRYAFLPYMYTEFYRATANGSTVARSLMEEFPNDEETWLIDDQFMFGPALMICPVTVEGAVDRQVYFPPSARWFDVHAQYFAEVTPKGLQTVPAPLENIPLYIRGGHVIPMQDPGNDTYHQKLLQPFLLIVAPDADGLASGSLFWDRNGVDDLSLGNYQLMEFSASKGSLSSRLVHQFPIGVQMQLFGLQVLGVATKPANVIVNECRKRQFMYSNGWLSVSNLVGVDLKSPLRASWN